MDGLLYMLIAVAILGVITIHQINRVDQLEHRIRTLETLDIKQPETGPNQPTTQKEAETRPCLCFPVLSFPVEISESATVGESLPGVSRGSVPLSPWPIDVNRAQRGFWAFKAQGKSVFEYRGVRDWQRLSNPEREAWIEYADKKLDIMPPEV